MVIQVDHTLFRKLNDYVFQGKSLNDIISEYDTKVTSGEYSDTEKIKNGKTLYDCLRHELKQIRKDEEDLIQIIVEYLFDGGNKEIAELSAFLETELKSTR